MTRTVPQAVFDSKDAQAVARAGHREACEELARKPRHMLDEGNPNHPRYDTHLFGVPAAEFMAKQYTGRVGVNHPDGQVKQACRLEVWNDRASPRAVAYRLFWVAPGESTGTPAIGYNSPGGSYSTVREAIADGVKRFGETAVRVRR